MFKILDNLFAFNRWFLNFSATFCFQLLKKNFLKNVLLLIAVIKKYDSSDLNAKSRNPKFKK